MNLLSKLAPRGFQERMERVPPENKGKAYAVIGCGALGIFLLVAHVVLSAGWVAVAVAPVLLLAVAGFVGLMFSKHEKRAEKVIGKHGAALQDVGEKIRALVSDKGDPQ